MISRQQFKTPATAWRLLGLAVLIQVIGLTALRAQSPALEQAFTVENYYKVKWGFADEFIELWKKNHYPLLKKALEKGDILRINAEKPRYHSGEDTRWDFKVILVFRNSRLAFDPDLTTPYKQQLYPDAEKLARDEQHRFELLIAHWDVMTESVPLP
jgi:hypothetical protein